MIYRFPIKTVRDMLLNQIGSNYFKSIEDEALISKHLPKAMERFENCIRDCNNKYYSKENDEGIIEPYFDPLHTCQWTLFLYFMANTIYKYENEKIEAARVVCDKIYGQSKNMSGCDIYFEVEMPEVFFFDHPLGSHLGRAKYGNGFSFLQGCLVEKLDGKAPVIDDNVTMLTGSKIIGDSHVGENSLITEGTIIRNENIPANSVVYGESPNLVIKKRNEENK